MTGGKASLETRHGLIVTHWTVDDETMTLHLDVPAGVTAVVRLPGGQDEEVGAGRHDFQQAKGMAVTR